MERPNTQHQHNEIQQLSCTDSDDVGSFQLGFQGQYTDVRATNTAEQLESALNGLSTIERVSVSYADPAIFASLASDANAASFLYTEVDPSITTLFNLGVTLEEGNVDFNEAISVYERALRLDAVGSNISPPGCHREMISEALADAWAMLINDLVNVRAFSSHCTIKPHEVLHLVGVRLI